MKDRCVSLWIGRNFTRCDNIYTFPKQTNGATYAILEKLKTTIPYQEATSATIEKKDIILKRNMAMDVKFLGSDDFEEFFMFTTNCRLKTPLARLHQELLSDDRTIIVGKQNFGERFGLFGCLAYGDSAHKDWYKEYMKYVCTEE
jgi:hypothetical protein